MGALGASFSVTSSCRQLLSKSFTWNRLSPLKVFEKAPLSGQWRTEPFPKIQIPGMNMDESCPNSKMYMKAPSSCGEPMIQLPFAEFLVVEYLPWSWGLHRMNNDLHAHTNKWPSISNSAKKSGCFSQTPQFFAVANSNTLQKNPGQPKKPSWTHTLVWLSNDRETMRNLRLYQTAESRFSFHSVPGPSYKSFQIQNILSTWPLIKRPELNLGQSGRKTCCCKKPWAFTPKTWNNILELIKLLKLTIETKSDIDLQI